MYASRLLTCKLTFFYNKVIVDLTTYGDGLRWRLAFHNPEEIEQEQETCWTQFSMAPNVGRSLFVVDEEAMRQTYQEFRRDTEYLHAASQTLSGRIYLHSRLAHHWTTVRQKYPSLVKRAQYRCRRGGA